MTANGRRWSRTLVAAVVVATVLAGNGPTVFADPAEPTDFRSTVDAITPTTDAIEVEVVGGDSFLELRVERGHDATVLGYAGEPYLRVLTDGTAQLNRLSPAVGINELRKGGTPSPDADASAPPDWQPVPASQRVGPGTVLWHDHRTHWMGGAAPGDERPGGLVQEWRVDLVVDGRPVAVIGSLRHEPPPSRWWWATALLALVLLLPSGTTVVAAATAAATTALLSVVTIDLLSLPGPARPAYTPLALLAVGLASAAAAVISRRRWWAGPLLGAAGAAAALAAWILRAGVTHRFVPGPSPDRLAGVAVVLAGAVGVIALARGVLASATAPGGSAREGGETPARRR